ncbi:MAG TPA: hypothetical protein VIY47_08715 [Ignavibacteriaceae bacterium]
MAELFRDDEFDFTKDPDEFELFEAMDRTSLVFNHLEAALYNHVGLNASQAQKAQQAFELLFDIYQTAGARFFETQSGK